MHYGAMAVGILLTGLAQVLLKLGMSHRDSWVSSFFDWRTLIGYGFFGVVTVLNVYAMQEIELKVTGAWGSMTYVLVLLLSGLVFKERMGRAVILGCVLISAGILVFNLPAFG
jgi:drug/metabolite transporter (DMT)-like permease